MEKTVVFIGPVIHSVDRDKVTVIPRAVIVVENGKIKDLKELADDVDITSLKSQFVSAEIISLVEGQFLIPGLIDTHIHAAQFPNAGLGYDKPLMDWLNAYTFPLEAKYEDTEFARQVYKTVVDRTLACGTTTAAYFGTVHRCSCIVLAETVAAAGQRALVGKVNMDCCCPPHLQEETATAVAETEAFIKAVQAIKNQLVKPIITPRFAPTCSPLLMSQLAELAHKHDLHIQTHMSENKKEIEFALSRIPAAENYAEIYDKAKLLTRKSLLAHCVFTHDAEVALLRDRGCSVAHCPNSNILLCSGLCDVRRLLNASVNVSLGTDVAGGCNPSVLDAIRWTLSTSISLSFTQQNYNPLTYHESFYLATMGGAIALDMEDLLGNFAIGKYFDALVIDVNAPDSPILVLDELTLMELFQKFIYTGDDRNIRKVYVNGNLVVNKN